MAGVNKAILVGNVGSDPEVTPTRDGKKMARFSLATSKTWKDRDTGERREQTSWHRIVVFNEALASICESYVRKGSKLYLEGEILTRKYEKGGQDHYATEIVLQFNGVLTLLDKAEGAGRPDGPEAYGSVPAERPQANRPEQGGGAGWQPGGMDDDIPFRPEWR